MRLLRNTRLTSISLSFFTNKIFYERVSKKNVKFKIRNKIDYLTTSQIFINEDYNIKKFKRFDEINKTMTKKTFIFFQNLKFL